MSLDLTGRVAIVTGAGGGLGRAHALLLARLGAKVVVNDLHNGARVAAGSAPPAETVVAEIAAAGGEAFANNCSVTDFEQVQKMVADTVARWGRVDILVNNAGILRDKTFAKMDLADFRLVLDVHLMGSVHCTKAVWDLMRTQNYGRIVFTTSSSGLYGNFGQSNYGAAKLALVGFMQTLALEGAKNNIRVNCIAPTAATGMMEGLLPPDAIATLKPAAVSPAIAALVAEDAPTRMILCAGGGSFEAAHLTLTRGVYLGTDDEVSAVIGRRLHEIADRAGEITPGGAFTQSEVELENARHAISLNAGTLPRA
jgi:NAD(P)-dependent dehydrogenase (short-subunit alcohol dehydrogenase family)